VVIAAGGVARSGDLRPLPLVLGCAAGLSLFWRRRAPVATLALSGALTLVLLHLEPAAGATAVIAPAVALYSVALRRGTRAKVIAAVAAVAAIVLADGLSSGGPTMLQTLGHALLVAIPLLIADVHRTRHANLALLRERLELAERTREQEAERRAGQERLRIARDLHDVIAHTLTTINVQASTAAQLLETLGTRGTPWRRSRTPAATPSTNCARSSACCEAATTATRRCDRHPDSTTSQSSCGERATTASTRASPSSASLRNACPKRCRSPPIASCRSR
jgi:Histidine kinase